MRCHDLLRKLELSKNLLRERILFIERVQNERKATIESDIVNNNKENSRPKREAAIMVDVKRKYLEG